MWLVFLMNAISGSTFTIGKIILNYIQPMPLTTIRMLISGIGMLVYYYGFSKKGTIHFTKAEWLWLLQFAFFGIYLSFSLEYWSLQYLTSSKTALLYNMTPLVTAVYAYFFFGEKMTIKKSIGLIVGFLGFLPTLIVHAPQEAVVNYAGFISWAEIALFVSVCAYAYGWVVLKKLMLRYEDNATLINGIGMLLGGVMAMATILFMHETIIIPSFWPFSGLLFLLIMLGNIIFYQFYSILLKRYTVTFLAFTGFTAPFFTAIYSYFLLHEPIGWDFYVSSLIVFIGLYIFYQEELRQGYIVKER